MTLIHEMAETFQDVHHVLSYEIREFVLFEYKTFAIVTVWNI